MSLRSRAYAPQSTLTSVTFWKKEDDQSMASSRSFKPCARLKSTQQRPSETGAWLPCTKSSKITKPPRELFERRGGTFKRILLIEVAVDAQHSDQHVGVVLVVLVELRRGLVEDTEVVGKKVTPWPPARPKCQRQSPAGWEQSGLDGVDLSQPWLRAIPSRAASGTLGSGRAL